MYNLIVKYKNIDSNKIFIDKINGKWFNIKSLIKNVDLIKEHSIFVSKFKLENEKQKIMNEYNDKFWFNSEKHPVFYINLEDDNGNKKEFLNFWNDNYHQLLNINIEKII